MYVNVNAADQATSAPTPVPAEMLLNDDGRISTTKPVTIAPATTLPSTHFILFSVSVPVNGPLTGIRFHGRRACRRIEQSKWPGQ